MYLNFQSKCLCFQQALVLYNLNLPTANHLLFSQVLLQLVEFVTTQPVVLFKSASDHYMTIFKHYLTLLTYNPTPVLRYCARLAEEEELDSKQIVAITDMIK